VACTFLCLLLMGRCKGNDSHVVLPLTRHHHQCRFTANAAVWPTAQASQDVCCRPLVTRGVMRGARGCNSPGAESLWGAKSLRGAPYGCGRRRKVPTMSQLLYYSTFASERPQFRTRERQTCFLPRALSKVVNPLLVTLRKEHGNQYKRN